MPSWASFVSTFMGGVLLVGGLPDSIPGDQMPDSIHLAHGPWLAEQSPVHTREITLALSEFRREQCHAFDEARVVEPARIDESERRALHQFEEVPLGRVMVADQVYVAEPAVELRLIKHFPPDVLE